MSPTFLKELTQLINRYSKDNENNTPDYLLAEYLVDCLEAYKKLHEARTEWYGEL